VLETRLLNAGYGKLQVIFNISAKIRAKSITAVLGPNGSGKSTFLRAISGFATIYSGEILYEKKNITQNPAHKRARDGIAYLPQTDNIFSNLTVIENLKIAGYLLDKDETEERIKIVFDLFPELEALMQRKAGGLSGGERQFLAIGSALIRRSKILLLDEPTAHLSQRYSREILERIVELRDRLDLTIVLVEQNVKEAVEISDDAYILVNGKIVFGGRVDEILSTTPIDRIPARYFLN